MAQVIKKKPAYTIPTMKEIESLPWNGFNVVSTFSGCGGSCLGYRMAGFKVLWANEFVASAKASYKRNHPNSFLDPRDIKLVQAKEILNELKLKPGQIDLFDGSPPCQAFSTAGQRQKGWNKARKYDGGVTQCNEQMFDEYIRLLKGLQPKVFIAENVSGLIKGTAKGYFLEILQALKACGYQVKVKLLDAQWLGVPQMRQRTIFIGVRNDLGLEPCFPLPFSYRYTVADAISYIEYMYKGGGFGQVKKVKANAFPYECVGTSPEKGNGLSGKIYVKKKFIHDTSGLFTKGDITNIPCPTVTGTPHLFVEEEAKSPPWARQEYDRLKEGETSKTHFAMHRTHRNKPCPAVTGPCGSSLHHPTEKRRFSIQELKRICAFPEDFVLEGSYAQQWKCLGNSVPPLMMKAIASSVLEGILKKLK